MIAGEKFSTFDSKYADNIGKSGTWEYEEKQDGQYTNRTLSKYPEAIVQTESTGETNMRAFGVIRGDIKAMREFFEKELTEIKEILNTVVVDVEPDGNDSTTTKKAPVVDDGEIPIIED